jgi:hypothetical protein
VRLVSWVVVVAAAVVVVTEQVRFTAWHLFYLMCSHGR